MAAILLPTGAKQQLQEEEGVVQPDWGIALEPLREGTGLGKPGVNVGEHGVCQCLGEV